MQRIIQKTFNKSLRRLNEGGMNVYTLLDGVKQHQLHPATFIIPSLEEKSALNVDDIIKLCFEEEGKCSERMWVKITHIDGDNFEGLLDNEPFALENIELNDVVKFNSKHIIGIF